MNLEWMDASVMVALSTDKMKAYITIKKPEEGGKPPEIQEIYDELQKNGVVYGIKDDVVRYLAQNPVYDQEVLIAEGTAPVHGEDGQIRFLIDINKEKKPIIMEDGSVNYRDLDYIVSAHKDQKICEIVPPTPGLDGKNVLGADIKAVEGKPVKIVRGSNIYTSEDNLNYYSAIDGQVKYENGKLSVFATYEVPADVDNSTGNINFIGSVFIRGNVLSGFTVEAGGDVEVFGVVEAATIKAGGNIILRRGMTGNNKGVLIAGGNIVAKYIENSTVVAANDLKAEAIMHSDVKCGNCLELGGRKGLLVGGITRVGKEIDAKVIGSYLATNTVIEVGVDPNIRERYKAVRAELTTLEENVRKTEQAIMLLQKLEAAGMLTAEKKEILDKSLRSKIFYENKLNEYREELVSLEEKLQMEGLGRIKVQNYLYNGVKISIGTASMNVKETLQYCTLYREGADIKVGAY
ncbi:MAG TPA: FapA family protein [Thermoclostridium sp.]